MTLSEFIPFYMETYVEQRNRPAVVIQKRQMLARLATLLGERTDLRAIDAMAIVLLQTKLKRAGCQAKTRNNYLTTLRNLLKWARKFRHVDFLPDMDQEKVFDMDVRYLQESQIDLLADRLEPLWRARFLFAVNTGLRGGELRALQWRHINWSNNTARVVESTSGRYNIVGATKGKARTVPLALVARQVIQDLDHGSIYVFARQKVLGQADAPLSYKACDLGLRRATRQVRALQWVTWHTTRHTFASRLVAAGVSLYEVQRLLGHVDIQTTERYAHLAPSRLAEAVSVLDVLR